MTNTSIFKAFERMWQHIVFALSGKADVADLENKQDKLAGTAGQVVGFDENGNAVAQEAPSGAVQSDWSVNDSEDPTYVKNRTHYEIPPENPILLDNVTATYEPGYDASNESFSCWLVEGYEYKVIFDGEEYITTAYLSDWHYPIIGNQALVGFSDKGHTEPFAIGGWMTTPEESTATIWAAEASTSHTITLIQLTNEVVKIDKKFLPDLVGENVTGIEFDFSDIDGSVMQAEAGAEVFNDYNTNRAAGICSHAEGYGTTAFGNYSHAEGNSSKALNYYSHAEGRETTASGEGSHAEGLRTTASGDYSHAEGTRTTASGDYSHAEGHETTASGYQSHAEGTKTTASGDYSHAEGYSTIASGNYQHVQGMYNIEDTTSAHIVGNGLSKLIDGSFQQIRSNAHTLDWDGNAWFAGDIYVGSTSGKNKDEGSKKLALVPLTRTVTLTPENWTATANDKFTQSIEVQGVSADEIAQRIDVMPTAASQEAYIENVVYASAQAENSLTFTAKVQPTTNLDVFITIQELS